MSSLSSFADTFKVSSCISSVAISFVIVIVCVSLSMAATSPASSAALTVETATKDMKNIASTIHFLSNIKVSSR